MGVYIKNWSLADWKELLKWAKIGANNAMIGEFTEIEEVQAHGRLIDADAFFDDLLFPSKQFEQGMRELIGDAPTVIPAEETIKEDTND